jgi:hypothetical protein
MIAAGSPIHGRRAPVHARRRPWPAHASFVPTSVQGVVRARGLRALPATGSQMRPVPYDAENSEMSRLMKSSRWRPAPGGRMRRAAATLRRRSWTRVSAWLRDSAHMRKAGTRMPSRSSPGWSAAARIRRQGLHARVTLAALELDPRNRAGRPAVGTELLADLILSPRPRTGSGPRPRPPTCWDAPSAPRHPEARLPSRIRTAPTRSSTRTRRGTHNAADPRPTWPPRRIPDAGLSCTAVRGCGPALERTDTLAATLPVLPGPSLAAHADGSLRPPGDRLQDRVDLLEEQLERMRRELVEARAELERIRGPCDPEAHVTVRFGCS